MQPCDFISLIAPFGLKLYLWKYAYFPVAFVPISYSGLSSGLRPGAIVPYSALMSDCRFMPSEMASRMYGFLRSGFFRVAC